MMNHDTGGRLGIFVQAYVGDIPAPDVSWGAVIGEFVVNYYLSEVAAVHADGKFTTTWGSIKGKKSYPKQGRAIILPFSCLLDWTETVLFQVPNI